MSSEFSQRRILAATVSLLMAATALQGQNFPKDEVRLGSRPYVPPAKAAISVQTNLVEVRVVVRDTKGHLVAGLRQSDFAVFDNGKPQTISAFFAETTSRRASADGASRTSPGASSPAPAPAEAARSPRFVALLFDDLNMQVGDVVYIRKAAERFITDGLESGDRVAVLTSSATVTLDFTDDTHKLLDSIAQLRSHLRRADEGAASCPRMIPYQAHLIINVRDSQATDLAIAEGIQQNCLRGLSRSAQVLMVQRRAEEIVSLAEYYSLDVLDTLQRVIQYLGKAPGRRMLLLTSSGIFTSTLQRQQSKIVDAALRADVVINALDAKGLVAEAPGGDLSEGPPIVLGQRPDLMSYADTLRREQRKVLNDPLALLSQGTGGRFFHDNNDLGLGFRELAATPEVSYMLGFLPENLKPDGRYHDLKVKLTAPGKFTVEARRGYYAPAKERPAKPNPLEEFDSDVSASDNRAEFPVEVTAQPGKLDTGEPVLRIVVRMDIRSLPFERRGDRSAEKLHVVAAVFDMREKLLDGVEGAIDLSVKDATLARMSTEGLVSRLTVQAPPGTYRLRVVVQEMLQGRMAALSRPVEIR